MPSDDYNSILTSSKNTFTRLCAQAESCRNTHTDELVSAVTDDIRAFTDGLSRGYAVYSESNEKEIERRTKLYTAMAAYIKRVYDVSSKHGDINCARTVPPSGAVSLAQFNRFAQSVKTAFQTISEDMSRYKKLKTDMRAPSLIADIDGEIVKLGLQCETYNRNDWNR